jgi:CRISPR-associated endoribonuclease Cas6
MPYSLILNLIPQSPIYPNFLTGRHYHALFLNLISYVDKNLGDHLHEDTNSKAFTLSPLQTRPLTSGLSNNPKNSDRKPGKMHLQWHHQQPIPPGTPCWWRISLLDDALFSQLTRLWLNLNPKQPWHLGSADLFITSIQGTSQSNQPWANASSYQQIYDNASDTDTILNFTFATPTAFRQGKFDTTLPTRESVFNSLLSRWNKYSNIEFTDMNLEAIYPSFFNIHTEITSDSRSKFIGFVGEVSYRILGNVEPLLIKQINTLADFALYCGVGRKTTMGMGMARRL